MSWSTRQLADLAGTSLRAVRHYHDVGLLPEPERRANGYKKYGVSHLVRLLRIKRLVDLGFSLPQISEMGDADEHPEEALRTLDAELAATIERLQRARVELGVILRKSTPVDLPSDIGPVAANADLSDADRSYIVVLSRVLGPTGLEAYRDVLMDTTDAAAPEEAEFNSLPEDTDEQARAELATRMAPLVRELRARHPGLANLSVDAPRGEGHVLRTMGVALRDLYNPAQIDVMVRMEKILADADAEDPPTLA